MITQAYALFDMKAQYFGPPFFCQSHGEAIRVCIDAASDMRSTVARYPNDFSLFHIGAYNNETALFTPAHPDNIGIVATMLPRQAPLPLEVAVPEVANNG